MSEGCTCGLLEARCQSLIANRFSLICHHDSTAHFLLMNSEVWIDTISQIDEAIEHDSCKLLVVVGPVCSGKTALRACWKKQHVLKYAEHREGERIEMVIHVKFPFPSV